MRLGESANDAAAPFGRPLDGVRIVSLEQMQALPFATQLCARLGADVIKVEQVGRGDAGRAAAPAVTRENGERIGATFLRNNLDKRSVAIEKILHKMGRGPFRWKGEEVVIVQRGDTVFFRNKNRKEALDI